MAVLAVLLNGHQMVELKYASIVHLEAGDRLDMRVRTLNPETG